MSDTSGAELRAPAFPAPPGVAEFEVGETFQISARGTVALAATEPDPWWPIAIHRVRVMPPGAPPFEAEASVEALRSREGWDRMALLVRRVQQKDLPLGSRIVSLGYTPHPARPAPAADAGAAPFARRWWQFWK